MPTPRESTDELAPRLEPHLHSSCPPEPIDRPAQWSRQVLGDIEHAIADVASDVTATYPTQTTNLEPSPKSGLVSNHETSHHQPEAVDRSSIASLKDTNPLSSAGSPQNLSYGEEVLAATTLSTHARASPMRLPYSNRYGLYSPRVRFATMQSSLLTPTQLLQTQTSCKLRAGSKYRGTQTSDAQRYKVEVDIKTVDMSESFICGYLKIEGMSIAT